MKYVIEVGIELTQEELDNLTNLSKQWNRDLPETVRECMNNYCEDMLKTFIQKPDNNDNENTN